MTSIGGSIPGEEELIENSFVPSGTPADQQQFFSVFFVGYDFEKIINVEIQHRADRVQEMGKVSPSRHRQLCP